MEMLHLLAAPFSACLVLAGIHCYLGLHVVARGVIFVDLALAQFAALGGAVALLAGFTLEDGGAYGFSLAFAFAGAAFFALARSREERIPQEAIIGIAYAVASAAAVLILDRTPHGGEEIKAMLLGNVLFVGWHQVGHLLLLYAAVGMVHWIWRKNFLLISERPAEARARGLRVRWWDFVFYATFALVVTSSVRIAGVLLVFTYLVVPAVAAILFCRTVRHRLLLGWGTGVVGSILGLFVSVRWDLPTGASLVSAFGGLLLLCAGIRLARPAPAGEKKIE